MAYRVGVDIGGTFADFCALDEATGKVHTLKVLSTPAEPGREVMQGIGDLGRRFGIGADAIGYFTHGTTVGINAVIQRKGVKLYLFTTENFVDVLELARLKMPDPYHLMSHRPEPLVTRDRVVGIRERTLADGTIDLPLDDASLRDAVARAKAAGAEGIVLSFLHSYANPAHENLAKRRIAELAPGMPVFCSSEVWPIIREFERTSTAVVHGYVQPRVATYIASLQTSLKKAGVQAEPMITKSNGGVMTAELGKTQCIQMLLSGTAAGTMGAAFVARHAETPRVLALDVGGTSADVSVIVDGTPSYRSGEMVGEFPIYIPTVSVTSIGAGGGSIARVDSFGTLTVGPESAGSTPGPACYGRGGTNATLTDAFVVCGFMGHSDLGYSAVKVDRAKAEAAMAPLAKALGRSVESAAEAVIQVAVSGMYREVSKLAAHQGVDLREFKLLAFGGGGPMTACLLARELGMPGVLVPTTPGVLSALGGLVADVKNDFIKTVYGHLDAETLPSLQAGFDELAAEATSWLRDRQGHAGAATLIASADLRYRGQSFEIETPLELEWVKKGDLAAIAEGFHREHDRIYGHADREAAVDVVALRMVVVGPSAKPQMPRQDKRSGAPAPRAQVDVLLDGDRRKIPLYQRGDLVHGMTFAGPCVIFQDDTTTVVPDGFSGTVDAFGNLHLARGA
ncbi:MAG: hydantoinase/oxoprolinase family protein [Alphaproteobacteria bacterium]|nr:hydantoinase/oxoprolinase family protein [Alphaproteobacteria bacterium]